jgi:hypothetical protein
VENGFNYMAVAKKAEAITISAPNIQAIQVRIVGDTPLMMARFSQKAMQGMSDVMTGTTKKGSRKARDPKDFDEDYEQAKHKAAGDEEWVGIPCSALRSALISACRLTGFTMTRAKLSLFVVQQGIDKVDSVPLFRLYGEPEMNIAPVRNATGVFDLRARPVWQKWYAEPEIRFDADQFSTEDVLNLLRRAGMQVGLLEGRPDSKNSAGMGFGTFQINEMSEKKPF